MHRTLPLLLLVAAGAVLLVLVRAPERLTGRALAARGHRVLGVTAGAVRAVTVEVGPRRLVARRTAGGWDLDGQPARGTAAEAVADLVTALAELRALDAFRSAGDVTPFGLDSPRGTITVETGGRTRRLRLGTYVASGAALYARREGDPRIVTIGTGIESTLERALQARATSGQESP
ncbi:MAG: DUF4340 domain-containing protein [Candidatus Binatia bacterium]